MTTSARDTIAAIATAAGPGAVGVIRLSGPRAGELAAALFRSAAPRFAGFVPRSLHHGQLVDAQGRVLDEALAVFMPGPGSFTGEDVAELHCHGGPALLRAVLEELLDRGARLALPGEFSRRAFLNGKLDLAQAEAIAEAIAAPTRAAAQLAQLKLSGALSRRIASVRSRLEDLRARLCLAVDFPDEDVECLPPAELVAGGDAAVAALDALLAGVERARAWREGLLAVLTGSVNAGKSSLMNALLGRSRALVSSMPGTTRDYIEEPLDLSGLLVRLADTAGLRSFGADDIEFQGQEAARRLLAEADLVVYVLDASLPPGDAEEKALSGLEPGRSLVALAKADLPEDPAARRLLAGLNLACVRTSARTGEGLEALCAAMREGLLAGAGEPDSDAAAPNARQAANIRRARAELCALSQEASTGLPYDVLATRLDAACRELAQITGEIAPDDVLNAIFSRFCIGK
jgi:tRNA modification GTPase